MPELAAWIGDRKASPLPPLVGTLRTPALELDGMQFEGVELEMLADDIPSDSPAQATTP